MEEILHHLGCIKPCKQWEKLPANWCRILPSTVMNITIPRSHKTSCCLPDEKINVSSPFRIGFVQLCIHNSLLKKHHSFHLSHCLKITSQNSYRKANFTRFRRIPPGPRYSCLRSVSNAPYLVDVVATMRTRPKNIGVTPRIYWTIQQGQ